VNRFIADGVVRETDKRDEITKGLHEGNFGVPNHDGDDDQEDGF
jgi:hypothetical protein